MCTDICVKCLLFLSELMKLEFSQRIFEKRSNISNSLKIPSSGSRVVPRGQTDRRTDTTKLIVFFFFSIFRKRLKTTSVDSVHSMHLTSNEGQVLVNLGYSNIKIYRKDWTPSTDFVWSIMGIRGVILCTL
jgi:hypothetical protein